MTSKHDDDEDDRKDLTRIEDLSEFLHQDDTEIDQAFGNFSENNLVSDNESSSILDINDLEDSSSNDLPPEIPSEIMNEASIEIAQIEEEPYVESNEENSDSTDFLNESVEESFNLDSLPETETSLDLGTEEVFNEDSIETEAETETEAQTESDLHDNSTYDESPILEEEYTPENLNDVKNFVQNFSYGTIEGAGNPPFSIIVKNIVFEDEAEDILALLKEFNIANDSNLTETEKAINSGSILIPQISEYTAIVLAHKLRRYDLDIEVGLSDEIHPSKSGEINPRGLTKKESIKQNIESEIKLTKLKLTIDQMFLSPSNEISGYKTIKNLGIAHAHTIINEEDLDRLTFVYKELRGNTVPAEDLKLYKSYKVGHDLLHDELINEIKVNAYTEGANALLSIQFTLNSFSDHNKTFYKLTCSCSKAIIAHE
jgi:uncharacterized protein YbjQ (UPF0145 family)